MFPETVTESLNDAVIAQARGLDAEQRAELTVTYVAKAKAVWMLQGEQGFIMLDGDNEVLLPVWPHKDLALAWRSEGVNAVSVSASEFVQTWLPGLEANATHLLLCPLDADQEDLVMSAKDLASHLADAGLVYSAKS